MADLQDDVTITGGVVSGTLTAADLSALGYDDPGYFLVLAASNTNDVADVTYTCALTDGEGTTSIELDEDGSVIIPVTTTEATVTFTATKEGYVTDTSTLSLADLTLTPAADNDPPADDPQDDQLGG